MKPILPVTLRDVARKAGVSPMSVSRALRGHAGVAEHTRKHILQCVEDLDYRAHPFVSALMRHVRGGRRLEYLSTIAHLVQSKAALAASPFYRTYDAAARQRAEELGYRLEVFGLDDLRMSIRRFERVLIARGIRGMLLGSLQPDAPLYSQLDWSKFAAITLGYARVRPALPRSVTDHFIGMQIALQQLRLRGYKRIGFYTDAVVDEWTNHRWSGAFLWEHRACKDSTAPHIAKNPGEASFKTWLRTYRPDAIVSNCMRVWDWIRAMRERTDIPGFVHLDYLPSMSGIAGIDQRPGAIAAAAVDAVTTQLERQELGPSEMPRSTMLEPVWKDGGSIRQACCTTAKG